MVESEQFKWLIPDVYLNPSYQTIIYPNNEIIKSSHWYQDTLLLGTSNGKLLINTPQRFQGYTLPTKFQEKHIYKQFSIDVFSESVDFLQVKDYTILLGSISGKVGIIKDFNDDFDNIKIEKFEINAFINTFDIENGILAMGTDSKQVVFNNDKLMRLYFIPKKLRFFNDCMVIMGDYQLEIYKNYQLINRISSLNKLFDFIINNDSLLVFESLGIVKQYNLQDMLHESTITLQEFSNFFHILSNDYLIILSKNEVVWYDLKELNRGKTTLLRNQLRVELPSNEVLCGSEKLKELVVSVGGKLLMMELT